MRFTLPRDIYHGKDSLEALKNFTGKKAFVCVGGGSMKRFGFLDKVVGYLKEKIRILRQDHRLFGRSRHGSKTF